MLRRTSVSALRTRLIHSISTNGKCAASNLNKSISRASFSTGQCLNGGSYHGKKFQQIHQDEGEISHSDRLKMGGRLAAEAFRQEELIQDDEYSFEDDKVELANPEQFEHQQNKVETEQEEIEEGDTPWYLREDESSKLDTPIFKTEIPEIPNDAPSNIEPILKFAAEELGLDELKIFDIRNRQDIPASAHIDYMILSTGKSERHIQNAVDELSAFLKKEFKITPFVEGLLKANSIQRQKKRMKRKARKGTYIDLEYGVGPNSWVMVDTKTNGVCFHVLTQQRREAVNLEYLWCKPEEREQYKKIGVTKQVDDNVDSIFHGLQRRNYSTSRSEVVGDEMAIQQFQIGDLNSFDGLKLTNPTSFLKHVIDDLNSKSLEEAQQEYSQFDNAKVEFFNNAFPIIPTRQDFELRYEFYSTLNKILPDFYPFDKLTTILMEQSSAGEFITKPQFDQFFQDLILVQQPPAGEIITQQEFNELFKWKFSNLTKILKIMDLQSNVEINNDFLKNLLLLSSQCYNEAHINDVPISRSFKILLDLYHNNQPDYTLIYLILSTFGKDQKYSNFQDYWENNLPIYKAQGKHIELDTRPWFILIQVLSELDKGKLNEWFINSQLPRLIENKVIIDTDMKQQIHKIMDSFGVPELKNTI